MSDPFKDRFDTEGLTVNPLAPSEVRRRGDRMRRRRNAAGVVAGVAAVALIATPLALFAGDGNSDSAPPADPPRGDWVTTIPDDFPLLVGVRNDPEGAEEPTISSDDAGLESVSLCASEVWPPDSVDRLAATDPAVDFHFNRELLLFPSDTEAKAALVAIRDALAACESETTTDSAIPDTEFELLHTAYDAWTGPAEGVTWTNAYGDGSIGAQVFQFVRIGNAIAGTEVSSESNKKGVADQLAMVSEGSVQLAGEMCLFAEEPCAAGSGQQVGDDPSDIPAGFPLDLRQRAMVGDGGVDLEPSEDVVGISHELICGAPIWTMDYLHRIGSMGTGPEFSDVRELRTYVSTDEAAIQMDAFLTAIHECPTYGSEVITPHEADTGQHSITWSRTYTDGLGSTLFQATRVGRAILVTADSGEGMLSSIETGIPSITETTLAIVEHMCVFTEAGCGASDTALSTADLIAPEETQPRYESAWETSETIAGEGSDAINPCFTEGLADRGASAVFRRDFDQFSPQGKTDGDWMTAVVADFPDAEGAAAAYDSFSQDMGLCAERAGSELDGFEDREHTTVELLNVEGEARAYFATYGYDASSGAVNRFETGMALVGTRVVILTTVAGPYEPVEPPTPTAMEAMLVQAAERLLPGPEGPITEPPVMP